MVNILGQIPDPAFSLPIFQTFGPVDEYLDRGIWWNMNNWQAQLPMNVHDNLRVYNHVEGRLQKETVHQHLRNNDLFVFNGASFYRGLQCAAVFVPPAIMQRLQQLDPQTVDRLWTMNGQAQNGLNYYFGKNDFPAELAQYR